MRMMLPALFALFATGCGLTCTEMWVPSGFELIFEASSWASGDYEIVLSGDVEHSCAVTLPADDTSGPGEDCGSDDVDFQYDAHTIDSIFVYEPLPEYLHVTVLLDGAEIAAGTFEPSYEITEPNGPGCGETIFATDTLTLN